MEYIVYKTTNLVNGKYYIGVHKTDNADVFDGYFGSSKLLKTAIRKYGSKNFKREVLKSFIDEDTAYKYENFVAKTIKQDPLSYNLAAGGRGYKRHYKFGGLHTASTEQRRIWGRENGKFGCFIGGAKCRDENLGFFALPKEERIKHALTGAINGMKTHSGIHTEDLELRREWAVLGGKVSLDSTFFNDGKRNSKFIPSKNDITFDEFLARNPQFVEGKIFINENRKSNAGKIAYNDGVKEYKFVPSHIDTKEEEFSQFLLDNISFVRGRLCNPYKDNPEAAKSNIGVKAYNDGIRQYRFKSSDPLDKELTEIEFNKFLSDNPKFSKGKVFKTNPKLAGTKTYNDGTQNLKFKSSTPFDKSSTEKEFLQFLSSNENLKSGRIK